jgi:hypothetical protein
MSDVLLEMLSKEVEGYEPTQTEQVTSEETTAEATQEVTEQVEVTNEVTEQTEATQVEEQVEEEVKQPKKIELDTKDWLESNEDKLFKYLKEKKTDYSSLKAEELVALKFKQDNPELSDEDIKEELADKYGIGLERKVIDEDLMDEDEIAQAKAFNKTIDKLNRQLKKDAPQAQEYFKQLKESLELPKFEFELPEVEAPVVNTEEVLRSYEEEIIKQAQEFRETQWTPTVKENVQKIESVSKKIEVEIEGESVIIEVNYKPSEADKKQLEEYMIGYVANDHDNANYVDTNNVVDFQRLFNDKAQTLLSDKIMKSAIVDALAKQKSAIYKKQVNYTDTVRNTAPIETPDLEQELMNLIRKK